MSAFMHSVFDRLHQGTAGTIKIFLETAGKAFADNPKIPIGQLVDLTNSGPKTGVVRNGLNNLANLLTGNVIKKADGSVVQIFSNAEATNVQFRGLLQAIDKSAYSEAEKSAAKSIARAGRDRNLAFDDFAKNKIDYVKDKNGNVEKMSFKDADGNYLGTITKNTSTDEAMELVAKFQKAEEKLNGNIFTDFMSPRLLSPAEVIGYNLPASASYYYCVKEKLAPGAGLEKLEGIR
jgi:hypothetical protein